MQSNTTVSPRKFTADRRGRWYKAKPAGGFRSVARPFYYENNRNSYPMLVEDKPDQWIAVWDSSNDPDTRRTAIRFGRLETRLRRQ